MSKKPIFWIAFAIVFIASVIFTFLYFSKAFPLVTLDLRMDRETALQSARELAQQHHWGPGDFKEAASFRLDNQVQNFVELECGGTEAFAKMLEEVVENEDRICQPFLFSGNLLWKPSRSI